MENNNLISNESRSRKSIMFIWIILVIEMISMISDILELSFLNQINRGSEYQLKSAEVVYILQFIIGCISFIINIISVVFFLLWFYRAYLNLHKITSILYYTKGWAIGSWFVPILNLYRPYKIMKELYIETNRYLTNKISELTPELKITFVRWWWALWIINNFFSQMSLNSSLRAKSINDMMVSSSLSILSEVLSIPLALITIKVIKDYTNAETILFNNQNLN
ncbi:MAG: DUF4328 domain-containing protein [Ignavibacteriae bacterium]|nr:DUF4328 domain-containing protein [Ignavibacteriota bacterium]